VTKPNGGSAHYRVVYSETVRRALRELLARARQSGNLPEVESAIRTIHGHLQTQPLIFGEPLNNYPQVGLQGRHGCVAPLIVYYSVDEARHLVYVLLPMKPLPSSGL
jgi:hypothetical protein